MSADPRMDDMITAQSEACQPDMSALDMSSWDCGLPDELNAAYAVLRIALGSMIFVHGYKKACKGSKLKAQPAGSIPWA